MEAPAATATPSADQIRDVNTRYHDVAAASYDSKWGIDFGEVGQAQVIGKLRKLLGPALDGGYGRSLEIGAGTGYFSLNLLQTGVVREATCTDISPGMLTTLALNADRLGLRVRTARADAESLPFPDASFDLVLGHAVLHHLPDLRARVRRVPSRAAPRRADRVRRRAVALRRPARRDPEGGGATAGAGLAGAAARRRRSTPGRSRDRRRRRPRARAVRGHPCVLAGRPRPARAARRLRRCPRPRRGARRQLVRVVQPRAGGERRPRRASRCCGGSTRSTATWSCSDSTSACSSRCSHRRSSTTC